MSDEGFAFCSVFAMIVLVRFQVCSYDIANSVSSIERSIYTFDYNLKPTISLYSQENDAFLLFDANNSAFKMDHILNYERFVRSFPCQL